VAAQTEFELVFNDPATGALHPGVQETIRQGRSLFATYPGYPDYRHVPVIGKGLTFSLPGSPDRWGMMCEADLEEACRTRPPGYRSMRAFCGLALATAGIDALLRHVLEAGPVAHALTLGAWAGIAAWLFHRLTVAPMARAIETMSAHFLHIAECGGPLSTRLDASSLADDGSASLARWINSFVDRTEEAVRSVSAAAARLGFASDELAGTSNAIAAASRQQSGSAADAASAVEQVTVSVAHVADNAAVAARLSDAAGEASDAGHQVVGRTARDVEAIAVSIRDSSTMVQRLGERSHQIDGIARTIHDIAGQTNLLALNAAIEAARAGEQGRGFAVVADEVRKLAERTSRSTEEIAEVIASIIGDTTSAVATMSGCTDKAGAGVAQAAAAARALEDIGRSVAENRAMIREIADATGAQRVATEGIARCIEEIARMTEANAQAVGGAEAAARHLQYLAVDLRKSVARFEPPPTAGSGSASRPAVRGTAS
jgi:methyl-accepting chemotaxis protein